MSEGPDLKNGAPELTKKTEKTTNFFFDSSVFSVSPFLRSGTSIHLRRLEAEARPMQPVAPQPDNRPVQLTKRMMGFCWRAFVETQPVQALRWAGGQ